MGLIKISSRVGTSRFISIFEVKSEIEINFVNLKFCQTFVFIYIFL